MRARSLLLGPVLVLAASVAVACGGGTSQLRNATEDDLSRLILQTEDAPTNYRRFDEQNSGLGLKRPGEYGSLAQY
ncbi:MAG: hypothetical protein M3O21_01220, partial [Chloroflexota bacterium]|nr:hypothetical protein [Chloroflexota bacterium]